MQGFDTARLQLDANSFVQSDFKGAHHPDSTGAARIPSAVTVSEERTIILSI